MRKRKTLTLSKDRATHGVCKSYNVTKDMTVFYSLCFGIVHEDTTIFDDKDTWCNFFTDLKQWRIKGIKFYGNTYCNGWQLIYEVDGKEVSAACHAGNHHSPIESTHYFSEDEVIISLEANLGRFMDSLTIITNKKKYTNGVSPGGNRFTINLPDDCKLLALQGGVGGHIHNIGVILAGYDWSYNTHRYYPNQFRDVVKTILLMSLCDNSGRPHHPETPFWRLPKEILFHIFYILAMQFSCKDKVTLQVEGYYEVAKTSRGLKAVSNDIIILVK